jgi:putative hydrolase of the HAD superfamily
MSLGWYAPAMPREFRAIVLDYGAVICRLPSPAEWSEFAAEAGMTVDDFIRAYARSRERYDRGLVRADAYWTEFGRPFGISYDAPARRRLAEVDIRVWSHIDDDLVAFVRTLRRSGLITGILSNMQPDLLDTLRRGATWMDAFDVHVFSCEVGFVKPERQVYDHLIDRLGVEPSRVLFLDDVADNVAGAKAAGLQSAVFTSLDDLRRLVDSAI